MPTRCINRAAQINPLGSLCLSTWPCLEVSTFIPPARVGRYPFSPYILRPHQPDRLSASRDRPDIHCFSQRAHLLYGCPDYPDSTNPGRLNQTSALTRSCGGRNWRTKRRDNTLSCNIASPSAPCPQCPACSQTASGRVSAAPRESIDHLSVVLRSIHTLLGPCPRERERESD